MPWWGPNKDRDTKSVLSSSKDEKFDARERASLKVAQLVSTDNDGGGSNENIYIYTALSTLFLHSFAEFCQHILDTCCVLGKQ